jgi:hypothetical protein
MELHVLRQGGYVKNCETLHLYKLTKFIVKTLKQEFDLFNSALEWEEEKQQFIQRVTPLITGRVEIRDNFRNDFPLILVMEVRLKYFVIAWKVGEIKPPPVLVSNGGFSEEELLENANHEITNKIRHRIYVSLGNNEIPGHYLIFQLGLEVLEM